VVCLEECEDAVVGDRGPALLGELVLRGSEDCVANELYEGQKPTSTVVECVLNEALLERAECKVKGQHEDHGEGQISRILIPFNDLLFEFLNFSLHLSQLLFAGLGSRVQSSRPVSIQSNLR
jgi:hypothetical protein